MLYCPGGTLDIAQIRAVIEILSVELFIHSSAVNMILNACVTEFVEFVCFACAKEYALVTRGSRYLKSSRTRRIFKPCRIGVG